MLDSIDERIVRLLRANGRLSQEQLGREVHLSRPAVHERVHRLEEQGVIRGYGAEIEWAALGLPLLAFIWVRTVGPRCNEVGARMLGLSDQSAEVVEVHRVTGEWCLLLKARAASPVALQDLIDRMHGIPGIQNTMTTLVLSSIDEVRERARHAAPNGDAVTRGA